MYKTHCHCILFAFFDLCPSGSQHVQGPFSLCLVCYADAPKPPTRPDDAIAAILAPKFANMTCFNSNMHRSNPSSCLLSPGPPWDSASHSTPSLSRRLKQLRLDATPIPDRSAIPIRSPKRPGSLRCEVMQLGDSTHGSALARTTDSNSKPAARDCPIDSAPQGVPAWRLRGTLSVIGKTRSHRDQSMLEIATSPSGLDAPDHRDFPKIRIDAVQCRDVPFELMSEVDLPARPQVPIRCRPYGGGSPLWVSSVDAGTCRKVE